MGSKLFTSRGGYSVGMCRSRIRLGGELMRTLEGELDHAVHVPRVSCTVDSAPALESLVARACQSLWAGGEGGGAVAPLGGCECAV
eukprot:6788297-Ditylum_brightwellii.AAC.1